MMQYAIALVAAFTVLLVILLSPAYKLFVDQRPALLCEVVYVDYPFQHQRGSWDWKCHAMPGEHR